CNNLNFSSNVVHVLQEKGTALSFWGSSFIFNDNVIHGNLSRIRLAPSTSAIVENNVLYSTGFNLEDVSPAEAENLVHSNNTVNGKPLGLYINENGLVLNNSQMGQIIFINSSNIEINDYDVSNVFSGIELIYCNDSVVNRASIHAVEGLVTVESNNISLLNSEIYSNNYGIFCEEATDHHIDGNLIHETYSGIYITESTNNTITNNIIFNATEEGIYLEANNTIVTGNVISVNITSEQNEYGIYIEGEGMVVYHNIFFVFGNTSANPAVDYGANTIWYNETLKEGNFWSNANATGNYTVLESLAADLYPLRPDLDGDGLSEYAEVYEYGTNPFLKDTDGDSVSDGIEIEKGTDPLDPNSTPILRSFAWFWILLIVVTSIVAFLFVAIKMKWIKIKGNDGKNRENKA
ncbi:MAG: NosD domain-containing protein, partial [Promethearchaeota archaeon]